MKLTTCDRCGRPYYDNSAECPYCGHSAEPSEAVAAEEPLTTPVDKGNQSEIEVSPVHQRPVQPDVATNRAEAMARLSECVPEVEYDDSEPAPDEADTTPLPRKWWRKKK